MMEGRFLFLGTGAAFGIPQVACTCSVCSSSSLKNKRLRSSGLLLLHKKKLLIDAGHDFRQQALKFALQHLDGILFTHLHADHIAGCDDLRNYYYVHHKSLPCLLSVETKQELMQRFYYLFAGGYAAPFFDFCEMKENSGSTRFAGIDISYVSYFQGDVKVMGYRVGNFAYLTDVGKYDDAIFDHLRGVDILAMSALRHETTAMHLGLDDALVFAKNVGAKKTYFTHISHAMDHESISADLPPGFFLAYDGLELPFTYAEDHGAK